MKAFQFALAAAILVSGSPVRADNPLIPNDNDHMSALGFAIHLDAATRTSRHGAQIVTAVGGEVMSSTSEAGRVSPGFLLNTSDNDQKQVDNQYAR